MNETSEVNKAPEGGMTRRTALKALGATLGAAAFAQAGRNESRHSAIPGQHWLFSRRNAILSAIPFAIFGGWTGYLIAMFIYAAASFFFLQHARRISSELTPS